MTDRFRTSRRGLLTLGTAAVAGTAAGTLTACGSDADAPTEAPAMVAFGGARQAGIATAQQDRLAFAAYDLTVDGTPAQNRDALRELLKTWTAAARAMCEGKPVPGENKLGTAPPADTGEAFGSKPANLTVTIGFGPSLFDQRFGLAAKRPAALADLPKFAGENLDTENSNGDVAIQACSDDPMVAFHAIRNLARLGRGTVVMRWSQLGFGRAASTSAKQETPRNLFGFKDGTRNIHDAKTMDRWVFVGADTDQKWMRDGSYLVARKIRMRIEAWDRDFLTDQQNVFGRHKYTGAPLTGGSEFDKPNFAAKNPDGSPTIPVGAHMRLAARENNGGVQILRRAYNYTDGMIASSGELDAGLFFLCYQRDPRSQFVALQRKLSAHDALNEYITHVGSGLYACPGGVGDHEYWGQSLLAD
ncbi:iron uptake transporter deferrochelatase/peroxidase subunit [Actinocatenispora sera]|uniref:Deferrochelatase n=1 Tax=Actinocatenispora sera TaxID=390989 RepID=A0A810KXX7_9ACTN|nr:iron uptake transporter deferrochelatase/peroxidase subunit [Actinocatenispora sera]BCJ27186.1 peroxidase [Actinocatenispora sera]